MIRIVLALCLAAGLIGCSDGPYPHGISGPATPRLATIHCCLGVAFHR